MEDEISCIATIELLLRRTLVLSILFTTHDLSLTCRTNSSYTSLHPRNIGYVPKKLLCQIVMSVPLTPLTTL